MADAAATTEVIAVRMSLEWAITQVINSFIV